MFRGTTFGLCMFETGAARIEPDAEVHFGVLVVLAAAPLEGIRRDELVSLFWPDEQRGRHCLRQAVYRLRQLDFPIRVRGGRIAIAGDDVQCDLRQLLYGAPSRQEAVRLGSLPFLPTVAPKTATPYVRWLDELRERAALRLRQLLAEHLAEARANGRFHEVGQIARALLAQDPLNENGTLGLAESLALEGSKIEAIRILEDYEAEVGTIREELRIAPRTLRRRVSECLDDTLLPRRFEIPFVGREGPYGELRAAWQEARGGDARCVVLTGEAGIGKTRLASEVLRLSALDGTTIAAYAASAGDSFTPISTLVSVGRALLALPGALGCAEEHLRYVQRLGTPDSTNVWSAAGMAADIAYAQLVHALAELIRALADEAPLVLFLDDAQRLHQTSWRVMFDILDRTMDVRFLLVFATRRLPAWFGTVCNAACGRLTRHVRLTPFAPEESSTFMERWRDKNRITMSESDAAQCARTSGGNPFYLGELAAHVSRGGDVQLAPKSIRELIEIQYAAVGKGAQRLLLVIALFESRATLARVTHVMDLGADDFMAALDEIEESGLIAAKGAAIRCKHDLVAETAIGLAMEGVQMFARVRIAELLEREADDTNSVELLGDCVTHWERAGETRRAYQAAMKLGGRLVELGMGTEAEKAYERANASAQTDDERLASTEGLMIALRLSAKWHAIRTAYEQRVSIRASTRRSSPPPDLFDLIAIEGTIWEHLPSASEDDLVELARNPKVEPVTRRSAITLAAMLADSCYNGTKIEELLGIALGIADCAENSREILLFDLVHGCSIGDRERALTAARSLAAYSLDSSDHSTRIQDLRRSGAALLRIGASLESNHLLMLALEASIKYKLPMQAFATREHLVRAALLVGDIDAACAHVHEMVAPKDEQLPAYLQAMRESALARICWESRELRGDLPNLRLQNLEFNSPFLSAKQLLLADRIAMQLIRDPQYVSAADIDTLHALHTVARGFAGQDYPTEVLLSALVARGDDHRALAIGSEFIMHWRRDLSAPSPRLGQVLEEAGWKPKSSDATAGARDLLSVTS